MRAPILWPSRGDVFGVLFVIVVLAVLAIGYLYYPALVRQRASGANFGPDWDCQYVPKSEPICIKKTSGKAVQ